MKIEIKKNILLEELNKVSKALSSKNIIPVLAGICFEVKNNKLILTASDNDITIQTYIDNDDENLKIQEEGNIVIQGRYILDIVRKLPDEVINIEVIDDSKVLIYTDNSEFNLNGINIKEYPSIKLEESKNKVMIDKDIFNDIINQTCFAASTDESKPTLTGINFNIVGNILECNSTDSYRLSRKIVNLSENKESFNLIIPSKNLLEYSKILSNEGNIEINIFNNKLLFKYNNMLFQTRLISGSYPNTSNLIPEDHILKITVDKNLFYNTLDRTSILATDKEKNIITLEIDNTNMKLKSYVAEIGKVEEKMQIINENDESIKISFSSKYMMDALKAFSTDNVNILFFGEVKPIIIKSNEDETLTELVLPIRTY